MADGKLEQLRDIAHRFRTGQLTLHQAAMEAGMSEDQFEKAVKGFAWVDEKAGQAGRLAGGAASVTKRLWGRWTKT
ncbi:MAG TPA: hypothetical protein VK009_16265 [Chloroflexota bacterium]|nr:hypothetical protein [Chloroflexota bacterium]